MVRVHPDPPDSIVNLLDKWGISSAGRAPALQAGGRRFDPVILHHHLSNHSDFKLESEFMIIQNKSGFAHGVEALFVLIDIDRLTSVERRTAVL